MKWKRWTKEEEEKLIDIYSDKKNSDIANILNKDQDQIERKAGVLKLKKSKEQIGKNTSNRNKIIGRDLSYENLKKIAMKYKTRGEFQRLDASAYTTARIAGFLDDICSHMITSSFSIPQLVLLYIIKKLFEGDKIDYNEKNAIKPYELDVYIKKYKIGFEYDGKLWHLNNELDIIKTELCKDNNITLIRLKENNRKYIQDIKTQLIENLNIINQRCNKKFNIQDILNISEQKINDFVNDKIVDEKEIKSIISNYTNYHDFKTKETSLYQKLIKKGLINKYTSELERDRMEWTQEKAKEEIGKFEYLLDFIQNSNKCYNYIIKNNLSHLLKNLKRKNRNYFSETDIQDEINKYEYLDDFRKKSPKHYYYIKRYKKYNLTKNLKKLK